MSSVTIKVNEMDIPLNEQMETMLINLVLGYLKSAKKIPEDIKKVNIEISF